MTLCAYCHRWLRDCACVVGFLPTEKSPAQSPRKDIDAYVGSEVPGDQVRHG